MKPLYGFFIGYINGITWPILVIYLPYYSWFVLKDKNHWYRFILINPKKYQVILIVFWFAWVAFALFVCVVVTIAAVKISITSVINFKEDIGKYIGLGIAVGIITLPSVLSLYRKNQKK